MAASARRKGRAYDSASGYGWISIVLHWGTAAIILSLWYFGSLSQVAEAPDRHVALIRTHTTLAILAYPLLWGRVIWRVRVGHPGPSATQHVILYRLAGLLHYVLVGAVAVMLISGPLMVLSAGEPLWILTFSIPSPLPILPGVHGLFRTLHAAFATVILVGVLIHVSAVIFHVAVMRDGSFDRIMVPAPASTVRVGPEEGGIEAEEAQ